MGDLLLKDSYLFFYVVVKLSLTPHPNYMGSSDFDKRGIQKDSFSTLCLMWVPRNNKSQHNLLCLINPLCLYYKCVALVFLTQGTIFEKKCFLVTPGNSIPVEIVFPNLLSCPIVTTLPFNKNTF